MHPFVNEILISLSWLSSRKHMPERANLPRNALSLGHEIPVDGRIRMNQMLSNAALGIAAGTLKAWTAVTNICRTMLVDHTKSYQPELHYMRGPGPKWREKHACQRDSAAR
jgi:hypothetical protein